MISKNRDAPMVKPLIVIVGVCLLMMTALSASMISAQQPQPSGSKSGTIASIQTDNLGTWILSGGWDMKNINSASPTFNSTFHMVMLNGKAPHMHHITDFKVTGSPIKSGMTTTYNGTATVSMKGTSVSNVPVSVKLMGHAMSLWIDPTKVMNHFGNTPIYGFAE
jgi:hypothetical protein